MSRPPCRVVTCRVLSTVDRLLYMQYIPLPRTVSHACSVQVAHHAMYPTSQVRVLHLDASGLSPLQRRPGVLGQAEEEKEDTVLGA